GNTCIVGTAEMTACSGATVVTAGAAMSDMVAATAPDLFEGSCFYAPTAGGEKVYKVVVPALTAGQTGYDIIASTGDTTTYDGATMLDTYVYIRTNCGNPATEVACNDDIDAAGNDYRSTATAQNQAAGNHFIFVDTSSKGSGANYTFKVTLRPVL